jgi:hypothetical protein
MTDGPPFTSCEEYINKAPLYVVYEVKDQFQLAEFMKLFDLGFVDGFCKECDRSTLFQLSPPFGANETLRLKAAIKAGHFISIAICPRAYDHRLTVFSIVAEQSIGHYLIMKVGQWPSLADLAVAENKKYSSVISPKDRKEISTAVGLAAHGVGIGSFVYLRRILERLIQARYGELDVSEKASIADWEKMRFPEKIKALEGHIPSFMVENRSLYSILSLGIHELTEDECRADFELLYRSVLLILDEDASAKEREVRTTDLRKALNDRNQELADAKRGGKKPTDPTSGGRTNG